MPHPGVNLPANVGNRLAEAFQKPDPRPAPTCRRAPARQGVLPARRVSPFGLCLPAPRDTTENRYSINQCPPDPAARRPASAPSMPGRAVRFVAAGRGFRRTRRFGTGCFRFGFFTREHDPRPDPPVVGIRLKQRGPKVVRKKIAQAA